MGLKKKQGSNERTQEGYPTFAVYRGRSNFQGDLIFVGSTPPQKLNPQKFENNE